MTLTKKFLLHASVAIGLSATVAAAPALAANFSTSGPVTKYCSDGVNTFFDGQGGMSCNDSLSTILSGNSSAPGGNLELNDATDGLTLTQFQAEPASTLTADFDGHEVIFSSVTAADWFGGDLVTAYGDEDLANLWFEDALAAHGTTVRARASVLFGGPVTDAQLFNTFLLGVNVPGGVPLPVPFASKGGFQRFSDPNIAYVNKDEANSKITFGLAGHQDAGDIFAGDPILQPLFEDLFGSEVVKVSHNGETNFFYSFAQPTDSGQVNKDGFSHNGNFEFMFEVGAKTPEPGTILGLMAVGGLFAATCRKSARK